MSDKPTPSMDLNVATPEQLELAYEIDRDRARAIVQKREHLGGFTSWDQLAREVPGMSKPLVANLRRAGLTIGGGGREVRTDDYRGEVRQALRENADLRTRGTHRRPGPERPGGGATGGPNHTIEDHERDHRRDGHRDHHDPPAQEEAPPQAHAPGRLAAGRVGRRVERRGVAVGLVRLAAPPGISHVRTATPRRLARVAPRRGAVA
jgi:hypothetical protein